MKKVLPLIIAFIALLYSEASFSQSRFSHEVGATFGIASYQTDFGQRNDFPSANAATMTFGVTYYLKFFGSQYSWRSGSSYFSSHFKLKTEFNFMNNKTIRHEVDYNDDRMKSMTGQIQMYNIGTNLEFYFFDMEDYASYYRNDNKLNPFINVGIHYSFYNPDILFNGESLEGKEEPYTDLMVLEGRWQHFFSDKVDGLDDTSTDSASDFNDTMVVINAGIIYVFGKY